MTTTPWGIAQSAEEIAPGIVFYTTAGHGGFHLSPERNAQVPAKYRRYAAKWSHGRGDRWYEEDCAALAVVVTFPEYFPGTNADSTREMLDHWVES